MAIVRLGRYEYDDYRTYRQRNQTYYGRDTITGSAPKYGTSGTATQEALLRAARFRQRGGFKDSRFASKPGGYRDSQYSTPAMRDPNGDHSGRTFGSGSNRPSSSPRAAPAPRPAPSRPSMPRSPGRTFGGSRRR